MEKIYQTKSNVLAGTNYTEVYKKAFGVYKEIRRKTRRRPYVRSAYFKKDKVFLELFWNHLHEKLNFRDKTRRAKFFLCAIELIQKSTIDPESKDNADRTSEILHRFGGITKEGERFFVQIKEEKRSGQKWLVSVFPINK